MNSNKKIARIAGLLYLVVVVTGIFDLMYVPTILIDWKDASATVENIAGNESLFRLGAVSSLVCYTSFLLLPFVLYQLLHKVNKSLASLMVILAVASVPISIVSILFKFNVLSLFNESEYLNGLKPRDIQFQVMLFLDSYNNGIFIAGLFWALWLIPFGLLVFRSGILPKLLGIILILGGSLDFIDFLGHSLLLNYSEIGLSSYITIPSGIGEIGICLWLLIAGAKEYSKI